jgi:hypothetical protein
MSGLTRLPEGLTPLLPKPPPLELTCSLEELAPNLTCPSALVLLSVHPDAAALLVEPARLSFGPPSRREPDCWPVQGGESQLRIAVASDTVQLLGFADSLISISRACKHMEASTSTSHPLIAHAPLQHMMLIGGFRD